MNSKDLAYTNSIAAIEDLRSLVASDFKPVADLALFHVQEFKQQSDYDWCINQDSFTQVNAILEKQIKSLFDFYSSTNKFVSKVHFSHDRKSFDLQSWDRMLTTLDLILRSMSFFRFIGPMFVRLQANQLSIQAPFKKMKCEGEIRVRLYSLIREFLKKETLFTFGLNQKNGHEYLSLNFDFSHRNDEFIVFETETRPLAFSSILKRYEVKNNETLQDLKHQVVIVDSSYQLSLNERIPNDILSSNQVNGSGISLYHLPFLFKPLSLIILKRAEVRSELKENSYYVDIFSLINN
jgi:hypothetical protein